jgi:putative hydrolase of the HAD superfamily
MPLVNAFDGFIFDYGGVLVHHQTEEEQAQMAQIAGIPEKEFFELYWADRAEYDRGVMTGEEYWHQIGKSAGKTLSLQQIADIIEVDNVSWMHFDEPMWEWVAQLKVAGKKVAILSNMPMDLGVAIKARTDRFSHFDHVTLSYEVKAVKPEPAIYEECLAGIGTELQKTVFFDDRIANVQGAELLGLSAIQFLDRNAVFLKMRG